jgi:hypothetical protein
MASWIGRVRNSEPTSWNHEKMVEVSMYQALCVVQIPNDGGFDDFVVFILLPKL